MKLDAKQLRDLDEDTKVPQIKRQPIYFILDNIYDTYNIGGLFRLADAVGASKVYLCGDTETPPNHRIKKASVGTYKVVPWEYKKSAVEAIKTVKKLPGLDQIGKTHEDTLVERPWDVRSSDTMERAGPQCAKEVVSREVFPIIIAIEQHPKAVNYTDFTFTFPLAFVIGNETAGISEKPLKSSDAIVQIPMHGVNRSLNVIVAAGVVAFHALHQTLGPKI